MKNLIRLFPFIVILGGCIYYFLSKKTPTETNPPSSISSQSNKRQLRESMAQTKGEGQSKMDDSAAQEQITSLWAAADYEAVTSAYGRWIFESPEAAIDFVGDLTFPMLPAHFTPDIKIYFDSIPPEEAMLLTLKLSNDHNVQESASVNSFGRWLAEDPETPIDWLFEHKDQVFTQALAERVGRLGHFGDPQRMLDEVLQRGESKLQHHLIKGVLINWLYRNEDSAIEYLNGSGLSSAHDEAITAYVDEKISLNPVTAMAWANTIKSKSLKPVILSQINLNWTAELEAQYQEFLAEEKNQ